MRNINVPLHICAFIFIIIIIIKMHCVKKIMFFVQNFPSMDIQIVLSKAAALAGKTL